MKQAACVYQQLHPREPPLSTHSAEPWRWRASGCPRADVKAPPSPSDVDAQRCKFLCKRLRQLGFWTTARSVFSGVVLFFVAGSTLWFPSPSQPCTHLIQCRYFERTQNEALLSYIAFINQHAEQNNQSNRPTFQPNYLLPYILHVYALDFSNQMQKLL